MALKDTLRKASQKSMSQKPIVYTQFVNQMDVQEAKFQENYRHLYKNVSGAWFSFGDEQQMRRELQNIGSFAMGRKVIAGIDPNLEMGSSNFISGANGLYSYKQNEVALHTDVTEDYFSTTMFHELLHAYQEKKGITLTNDYPSIEQCLTAEKIAEAETAAWDKVLYATCILSSSHKYAMTSDDVREIMKKDYVGLQRKTAQDFNIPFDEKEFKKNNVMYRLQQALIESRGNYDEAQRKMVGQEIKRLMNEGEHKDTDHQWNHFYNEQAVRNTIYRGEAKKLSQNGNAHAYNKMLKYYHDMYGLSAKDIRAVQLPDHLSEKLSQLRMTMDQEPLQANIQPQSHISHDIQNRNRGR